MNALRIFVFLGAFLLFSMEPMVGRLLLPHFGGGFHVWTTSLMFFQGALFLGYSYAHLAPFRFSRAHFLVLLLPLLLLPLHVRSADIGDGIGALLAALTLDFAVPFIALATTGVIAQGWLFRSSLPERTSPYLLYATSNIGSLVALIGYVFVVEPLIGLKWQGRLWAIGYIVYLGAAFAAYRATHHVARQPFDIAPTSDETNADRVRASRVAYWLLLSAFPSIFLMAVTNLIALDAGNVPLVWVVPLALYLLSFVLAFSDHDRVPGWIRRLWPTFASFGLFVFAGGDTGGTWLQVSLHLTVLFIVCLAAHDELYRVRPAARQLTLYYLVIAGGGWIGGAFVALFAPAFFSGLAEYPVAIIGLMVTIFGGRRAELWKWARGPGRVGVALIAVLIAVMAFRVADGVSAGRTRPVRTLAVRRSHYGIYHVLERSGVHGIERDLISGATRHGRQIREPEYRHEPLSYYHRRGPAGEAMAILRERSSGPLSVGAIGLGVGTMAAYAEPLDTIDFYEIDQAVVDLAEAHFTYLEDCRGEINTFVGDARLTLARRAQDDSNDGQYDLLLIDAFAGDAIPTHLVTLEAVQLYRSLLKERGILLFHISNRYYDLRPVLATISRALETNAAFESAREPTDRNLADPSVYFVMTNHEMDLAPFLARGFEEVGEQTPRQGPLFTDDHANTLSVLLPDWE
jgi:hypothetical protein